MMVMLMQPFCGRKIRHETGNQKHVDANQSGAVEVNSCQATQIIIVIIIDIGGLFVFALFVLELPLTPIWLSLQAPLATLSLFHLGLGHHLRHYTIANAPV